MSSLALQANTVAVRDARRFAQTYCAGVSVSADIADTVVLLTSELVTNALVHGRSAVQLSMTVTDGLLLVEVADDNSRYPHPVDPDNEALDGRGLLLVNKLAHRWGVRTEPIGKTVWFEIQS